MDGQFHVAAGFTEFTILFRVSRVTVITVLILAIYVLNHNCREQALVFAEGEDRRVLAAEPGYSVGQGAVTSGGGGPMGAAAGGINGSMAGTGIGAPTATTGRV